MSSGSWVRPPLGGTDNAAGLDMGRALPAWTLSAAALLIALAVSAPMLALNSVWLLVPVCSFVLAALRPSVGTMLLSLFLLLAGWYFSNDGISLLTPVLVLAVHALYVLYSVTASVPARTRISLPALKTLGMSFVKIQLIAQALTLLAILTEHPQSIAAVSIAAAAVLIGMVVFLWRATTGTGGR